MFLIPNPQHTPRTRIADTALQTLQTHTDPATGEPSAQRGEGSPASLRSDVAAPHCGHYRYLPIPQRGHLDRSERSDGVADFATALRTPQAPRHSGMQTWFAVGKGLSFCCGLRHRIADSWIALDYRHSNSAIRLALTIADFASLHCGQCRYLHTPRRG